PLQPGDIGHEIVQAQEQRVDPARLDFAAALPPVDQEPEIPGGVVPALASAHELDLQLALVESGLGLLAERLELVVEAVEQGGIGHGVLQRVMKLPTAESGDHESYIQKAGRGLRHAPRT